MRIKVWPPRGASGNDDKDGGNGVFDGGKQDHEARRDYSGSVLRKWQKEVFFCNGGGEISQIPSLLKNIKA